MTELEFHFETRLHLSAPIKEQLFALHCLPMEDEIQRLEAYQIILEPKVGYGLHRDGFGSWLVCGAVQAEHQSFSYQSHGIVRVDQSRRKPCEPNPVLRCPTPLTAPDERVRAFWQSLPLAGRSAEEQAELLNRAVSEVLVYMPGATDVTTTASQALQLGRGVCQDKAHLLLSLARLSGFAGRYCMGLLPGEGATHAWVELALPGGWTGFDPTHCCRTGEEAVRFAVGRDAADCRAERGVFKGAAAQQLDITMRLKKRI